MRKSQATAAPKPRTAADRLAAAKRDLAATEEKIDAAKAQRRECLMSDDTRLAAVADRKLVDLKLARGRFADKVSWLSSDIERERHAAVERGQQQGHWQHQVMQLEERLRRLRAKDATDDCIAGFEREKVALEKQIAASLKETAA